MGHGSRRREYIPNLSFRFGAARDPAASRKQAFPPPSGSKGSSMSKVISAGGAIALVKAGAAVRGVFG
jgi:hypothetical protein